MKVKPLFDSFLMAGFECSSHCRPPNERLDLIASSRHDELAAADYQRLARHGMHGARDGMRWHLIEERPYQYDFSSFVPMARAASAAGVNVAWDLCHYGIPCDLDIWSTAFIDRIVAYAKAATEVASEHARGPVMMTPMNEISYWSWAGGDMGRKYPFTTGRGWELKVQLARATIAACQAILDVNPQARLMHPEPVINIVADPLQGHDVQECRAYTLSMYQAWDLISGRMEPELRGSIRYLDIVGINYYPANQWYHFGRRIWPRHDDYVPVSELLHQVYERYKRPLLVSETGAEGKFRPGWLRYMSDEVRTAIRHGTPVLGLCWYPILNHAGWTDDRHCHCGLWDYAEADGRRPIFVPLAEAFADERQAFAAFFAEHASRSARAEAQRIVTEQAKLARSA